MFTLTENAVSKVRELLAAEADPALALRVQVRPGGCSGFRYEMFFDAEQAEDDVRLQFGDVPVLLDGASAPLLEQASLDYLDGLQGAGFKLENPGAKRQCGCGQSFS